MITSLSYYYYHPIVVINYLLLPCCCVQFLICHMGPHDTAACMRCPWHGKGTSTFTAIEHLQKPAYRLIMYFDGPPPRSKTKSSSSRNYVPQYRANGTGRDLISFWPQINVMPHTAKVYHAIKPINSKRGARSPHTTIPRPSGTGRDSFIWRKKSSQKPVSFRPTQTPWVSNSTPTPSTLSTIKGRASNCKHNLGMQFQKSMGK